MKPKKDLLLKAVEDALEELFSDTSVSKETTIEKLEEIQSQIDLKIMSLKEGF